MTKTVTPFDEMRPEADVFSDLQSLCTSPGYIHAIAYFCWRDNLIRYSGEQIAAKDLVHQHSNDRLLRTEISTLIGLMVKEAFDLCLPEPPQFQKYIERTESLLHELHGTLTRPWMEGWDLEAGKTPTVDPFANAAGLREPIFYGGEAAYNFQYEDLARDKYHADNNWLEANKGFRIEDAKDICAALSRLQTDRQTETGDRLKTIPPNLWTMLPGFLFTRQEIVEASGVSTLVVERFLEAFTCPTGEKNSGFTGLNEFNVTNSAPILRTDHETYCLLQHYSLLEAVYESPFYWMIADKTYKPIAETNRGKFTENFVATRLEAVFSPTRVFRNVNIYKGKDRFTEADALVFFGDRILVVQAKSKRLTLEARKGNDFQLKDDFKKAIQAACDQALDCAAALISDAFTFITDAGRELHAPNAIRAIFPICIVSDHYPALAFQSRHLLKATVTDIFQPPLVTDIFALDSFAEMLDTPLQFINYLALRARFGSQLMASNEIAILGFHLKTNLWLDPKYTLVNIGDDIASEIDIAMMARRHGWLGEKTPAGVLTRFDKLTIGRLIKDIEAAGSTELTGLGLLLLQLSTSTGKQLSKFIDRIIRDVRVNGQWRDVSVPIEESSSGITIHCNNEPDEIAYRKLLAHCMMRKHSCRANSWFGMLLDPHNGTI